MSVIKGILIEKLIIMEINFSMKIRFITDVLPHHGITYDVVFTES